MLLVTTFHRPLESFVWPLLVGLVSWPVRMGLYVTEQGPLPGHRPAALTLNGERELGNG